MLERATDATCSLRKTDSVAKALQSHTDTLVKVLLYRLDVAMSRLPRSMSRLSECQRYIFDSPLDCSPRFVSSPTQKTALHPRVQYFVTFRHPPVIIHLELSLL